MNVESAIENLTLLTGPPDPSVLRARGRAGKGTRKGQPSPPVLVSNQQQQLDAAFITVRVLFVVLSKKQLERGKVEEEEGPFKVAAAARATKGASGRQLQHCARNAAARSSHSGIQNIVIIINNRRREKKVEYNFERRAHKKEALSLSRSGCV